MSSALWSFFWDEGDWTGSPPPPPPPPAPAPPAVDSPTNAGGGGKTRSDDYFDNKTPEDFWDVREAYLRSIFEKTKPKPEKSVTKHVSEIPPAPPPTKPLHTFFPQYTADLAEAVSAVRLAETTAELKRAGERVAEVNRTFEAARRQQEAEAAAQASARKARQSARATKKAAAERALKLLLRSIGRDI